MTSAVSPGSFGPGISDCTVIWTPRSCRLAAIERRFIYANGFLFYISKLLGQMRERLQNLFPIGRESSSSVDIKALRLRPPTTNEDSERLVHRPQSPKKRASAYILGRIS